MSDAQGITTGDFVVEVSSSATGGAGGSVRNGSLAETFTGGNGGDAFATATGTNIGLSAVTVSSSAVSGAGGKGIIPEFLSGPDGISGNATAISTATGLGAVSSTATATGNFHTAGSRWNSQSRFRWRRPCACDRNGTERNRYRDCADWRRNFYQCQRLVDGTRRDRGKCGIPSKRYRRCAESRHGCWVAIGRLRDNRVS